MSKFTPGPWHVAAYNDALYITSGRPPASSNDHPLNDSDRTVIAKMFIPDCGSREANTALIADAPALLWVLELLLIGRHYFSAEEGNNRFCKECGQYITDEAHYRDGESRKTDEDKARALIAKHGGGV